MRRTQCAVTNPDTIKGILKRCRVGRLATNGDDGYPYITPLNFVYYEGSIYFHCARKGEKIDNIMRDSRVCFEVDIPLAYLSTEYNKERPACEVHQFYHSVVIRGRAEIVDDIDEKVASLNALMASHEEKPSFSLITADTPAVKICSVVAVRIESLTAKSDLAQKKDDETKEKIAKFLIERDLPGDQEAATLIRPKG